MTPPRVIDAMIHEAAARATNWVALCPAEPAIALNVYRVSQRAHGSLLEGFAERGMHMDRCRDVFEQRAHLQRQRELAGPTMRADRLDAEDAMIVFPRQHAYETTFVGDIHAEGTTAGNSNGRT